MYDGIVHYATIWCDYLKSRCEQPPAGDRVREEKRRGDQLVSTDRGGDRRRGESSYKGVRDGSYACELFGGGRGW